MTDRRAGGGGSQSGTAGIGKQIEHIDGPSGVFDLLPDEVPVGGLLGEDAGVLKAHGLDIEHQLLIVDGPLFGQLAHLPVTAAGLAAVIGGVGLFPHGAAGRLPDGLRVGAHQDLFSPALQTLTAAAVQQFIIFPVFRCPHNLVSLLQGEKIACYPIIYQFILPFNSMSVKAAD